MFTKKQKGFSLIEFMVAVAVFSFVMVIAVGALLSMVEANRKAQALKSVMNNLNFALESMVRTARTGSTYHCRQPWQSVGGNIDKPKDCGSADNAKMFAFESFSGDPTDRNDQVVYRFNESNNRIERSTDGGSTFIAVTAPEVHIESLTFLVQGSKPTPGDYSQPIVVIRLHGYAGVSENVRSTFELETMATQRLLDI